MRRPWALLGLAGALAAGLAGADDPAPAKAESCLTLDNRVLGPRSANRPFPLYTRDASGFHPACDATWSALSPGNRPMPVTDCCCRNSMLQIANESACGTATGRLWLSSRWVVTSAQLAQPDHATVVCQQLETGAWAGTRDFKVDCIEKKEKKDLQPGAAPAGSPPASTPPRTAARPPPSTPPRAEAAPPLLTPPAPAAGPDPAGPDR